MLKLLNYKTKTGRMNTTWQDVIARLWTVKVNTKEYLLNKGGDIGIKTKDIKKYLLDNVEGQDPVTLEKIDRYIEFVDVLQMLLNTVKEVGVTTVTTNATQKFTKANPALAEINKLNTQLLNIERSFKFKEKDIEVERVELIWYQLNMLMNI